ncbi:CopG family ribbon-helix-helix protein [Rhizobium binxianense]
MAKPVLSDPIALRLPEDMLKQIETIAAATERTRSWVIVRALKYYLAAEGKDILDILEGLEDVKAGRVLDAEVVFAELEKLNEDDAA